MDAQTKTLGWVAIAGSLIVCLPCACCLGFQAFGSYIASTISPEMLASFAGSGDAPTPQLLRAAALPCAVVALVPLAVGILCLVWGVRTLLRPRPEQLEFTKS
ncbi:MAG: hypothetical protein GTO63_07550 [Anaerolineae bacterium]|nr:hypothetical protein [Anaerolineae bacterium]NIN94758.1 hypothetical protein [Anaerolineae bacterium]NIQ77840.1 hypothetical protein [Anaerolineae bacterium]